MRRHDLVLAALLTAGCATTPAPAPPPAPPAPVKATAAADLVDHAGDSTDTAVEVPADAPDGGVKWENDWIYDRWGRFRRMGGGTGQMQGRRYDIVEFELPDHSTHKVFFDITENWKRWTPPK